jgi:hypothetical protein
MAIQDFRPEPSSGEPETRQTVLDQRLRFLARAEKAEGEAKALREALGKIEGLNSCNQDTEDSLLWEIRSIARAALAQGEGEVDHAVS